MEVKRLIFETKVRVISELTYNTLLEVVEAIIANNSAIESDGKYIIPLELSAYKDFKALSVNKLDIAEIYAINTTRNLALETLILELQNAILADLLIRYFDTENL